MAAREPQTGQCDPHVNSVDEIIRTFYCLHSNWQQIQRQQEVAETQWKNRPCQDIILSYRSYQEITSKLLQIYNAWSRRLDARLTHLLYMNPDDGLINAISKLKQKVIA